VRRIALPGRGAGDAADFIGRAFDGLAWAHRAECLLVFVFVAHPDRSGFVVDDE